MRLIISRKICSEEWSFKQLLKAAEEETQARKCTSLERSAQMKRPRDIPTASALLSGNSGTGPTCSYCHLTRRSASCRMVVQVDNRRCVFMKTGRCFICLRRGHVAKNCRLNVKCLKCNSRHHVSICPKGPNKPVKAADIPGIARHEAET